MREHGLTPALPRIATSFPSVLALDAENDLAAVLRYMQQNLHVSAEGATAAVRHAPQLLAPWALKNMQCNVASFEK